MKTLYTIALALFTTFMFADSHILVKQNGEKIEVNYVKTANNMVYYSLKGNSELKEISAFAVEKIIDKKSNNVVVENARLNVSGKEGYKKVQVIESDQALGLHQAKELSTVVHKAKGQSKEDWTNQALLRIKKQAAEQGLPYVVIIKQNDSRISALGYAY